MVSVIHTYTHGFNLNVPSCLSKANIIEICKDLDRAFGPGNAFRPEPIGSGFLIWSEWPGKDEEGYKCMRLSRNGGRHWPIIREDVMESWEGDGEPVIVKGKYCTFLKSFGTAPKWTGEELGVIRECLTKYGTKPGPIPSQKKLDFKKSQ